LLTLGSRSIGRERVDEAERRAGVGEPPEGQRASEAGRAARAARKGALDGDDQLSLGGEK
jgi:hypothetical protein